MQLDFLLNEIRKQLDIGGTGETRITSCGGPAIGRTDNRKRHCLSSRIAFHRSVSILDLQGIWRFIQRKRIPNITLNPENFPNNRPYTPVKNVLNSTPFYLSLLTLH